MASCSRQTHNDIYGDSITISFTQMLQTCRHSVPSCLEHILVRSFELIHLNTMS